jgi:anthranilate phosphoribosyltransferase
MKYAIGPRRELAVRTVFNILGPLTNPAGARRQVLGVFSDELLDTMASVLMNLGGERALIVHSADGLDEISICDETSAVEASPEGTRRLRVAPEDFGLTRGTHEQIAVDGPDESADVIRGILGGRPGAPRDIVLLNAGAAAYVGGKADSLSVGVEAAAESIDTGRAREVLDGLVALSSAGD